MHFYMLYGSSNYTFGSVCHFLRHWTIFGKGALKHSFFSIADDYYDDKISVVSSLGAGVQKAKQERHRELEQNASQC